MEENTATSGGSPLTYPDPSFSNRQAAGSFYIFDSSMQQTTDPDPGIPSSDADNSAPNGQRVTYPDPTKSYQNPYPVTPASTYYSAWPGKPPSWSSSPAKTDGGFMSLADYFNLGSVNRAPSRRPRTSHGVDTDYDSEGDAEAFNHAIQTSGSLPGCHFLPEHDQLSSDFINGQLGHARDQAIPQSPVRHSRGEGLGRGRGRGRGRGWKQLLKGTEHADLFSKPQQKRQGTGRKPGRPKASDTGGVDPGPEFKEAQAEAMQAFMSGSYDEALELVLKAIQANSEVFVAHHLVYQILEIQGRDRDAFEALTMGAITKRDAGLWIELSERLRSFEGDDKREGDDQLALEFLRHAVVLDKTGKEPRVAKLNLYIEFEMWDRARRECRVIVEKWPDDLEHLMIFAELCAKTTDGGEWRRGVEAYRRAFNDRAEEATFGEAQQQWTHLNVYIDLLCKQVKYEQAVFELKKLARWFLGRKEDTFWDEIREDDQEYDVDNSRRVHQWQFQQGRISRDPLQYGAGLPMEIRVKLGLLRFNMGFQYRNEALRHFDVLWSHREKPDDYYDLFFDVGETFRQKRIFDAAVKFYEPIASSPESAQNEFRMAVAECYNQLKRYTDAQPYYEKILADDMHNLQARAMLAKAYESTDQHALAQQVTTQLLSIGRADLLRNAQVRNIAPPTVSQDQAVNGQAAPGSNNGSMYSQKFAAFQRPRPSKEVSSFEAQRTRVQKHHAALEGLSSSMDGDQDEKAVQQWMHHAEKMLSEFKNTKALFQTASKTRFSTDLGAGMSLKDRMMIKEMEAINRRTQGEEGTSLGQFLDISFADWHRILSELALLYAKYMKQEKCYDVLQSVLMKAMIFRRDLALKSTTLAVCMCCAQMFNDGKFMAEMARQYIDSDQTGPNTGIALLAASGRHSYGDMHLTDRKIQDWMLRLIRAKDFLAMPSEMRSRYSWGSDLEQFQNLAAKPDTSNTELDAGLLALYADITNTHKHGNFDPGLPYLLRALALQPENPVINLNLATTYVTNAMEKTTTNRQYDIAQGLAFLYRYYDLRIASGKACHLQEAEYNVARMWHQLGMTHLAVPAYEKVLKFSEQAQKEYAEQDEDCIVSDRTQEFAKEAALALQSMFAVAGNMDAAKSVTEKWLVL